MWYIGISLLAVIAIQLEKSNRSKLAYSLLACCFPTVAYSIWRANSEGSRDSKLFPVLRLGIWFSVSHSILSIVWIVNSMLFNIDSTEKIFMICCLWAFAVSFSLLLGFNDKSRKRELRAG